MLWHFSAPNERGRMKLKTLCLAVLLIAACSALLGFQTQSTSASSPSKKTKKKTTAKVVAHRAVAPATTAKAATPAVAVAKTGVAATAGAKVSATAAKPKKRGWVQTWDEPTFAESASGDDPTGEDLTVRSAAIEALGPYNGSIVVADATTGRILTMVNQKLALEGGFQPCSTIKVSVALAALREKIIPHTTPI